MTGTHFTDRRAYFRAMILFLVGAGAAFLYWATRPPASVDDGVRDVPHAEGTAGQATPGGHNPDPRPGDPREEIEDRSGRPITNLDDLFEEGGRNTVGRRVEIANVKVERVESPTLFWIRHGDKLVAVVGGAALVRPGQAVKIAGAVERVGDALRIRASRVEAESES